MKLPRNAAFSIPEAIFDAELLPNEFVILSLLFRKSDSKGRVQAGYETIMKEARIASRNTVAKALGTLRKKGWIDKGRQGGHQHTVFSLRVPDNRVA